MECLNKFKLEVTAKHISNAIVGTPNCPIKLAFQEMGFICVVRRGYVDFYTSEIRHTKIVLGRLPTEARRFIDAFDSGSTVKPFAFIIEL